MKALVYLGERLLDWRDVPDPTTADGEVRLRVEHVGLCGSDLHAWLGHDERRPPPLILGHEIAGTIMEGVRAGERVTVNPLVTCGECTACRRGRDNLCQRREILSMPPRAGGFAEIVAAPLRGLVPIPDTMPTAAAALAEPIACGWHAVRLAGAWLDQPIDATTSVVIGAGAIGVGTALSLRAAGATQVLLVDTNRERLDYVGERLDLDTCAPDALARDLVVDLVFDAVGLAATRSFASARVRPGGVILHLGLGAATDGLDVRRITLQEIAFVGTYTYTQADFQATVDAMSDGRLGALDWIQTMPLAGGAEAFRRMLGGNVVAPKIMFEPDPR